MTDLLATLKQLALVPREATDAMEIAAKENAKANDPTTFADIVDEAIAAAPVQVVSEAMLREAELDQVRSYWYDAALSQKEVDQRDDAHNEGFRAAFQILHDAGLIKLTEDVE